MRIIAVMSPKGGIGKTTTSDAIAYMLGEEQEKRVLILDGDPQGDTSKTFEAYEPEGTGMSELLERHVSVGGSYRTTDLIRPTQYSHIDIIPANGYLMQTDMKLLLKQEANQVTRLRDALEEISEAYDYCICDCGRLLDMVVINILLAAELVIAPVKVGGYENEAIHNLQEQVDDLREINPELRIKGLVTMRQKNKTSLDFEEWMKTSSGFDMFVTPIRRSIVAEKASMRTFEMEIFPSQRDESEIIHSGEYTRLENTIAAAREALQIAQDTQNTIDAAEAVRQAQERLREAAEKAREIKESRREDDTAKAIAKCVEAMEAAIEQTKKCLTATEEANKIIISQSGLDAILAAVKDYYERIRELETDININVDGGTPKSTDLLLVKGGTPFTTDYDKYIAGTSHTI